MWLPAPGAVSGSQTKGIPKPGDAWRRPSYSRKGACNAPPRYGFGSMARTS